MLASMIRNFEEELERIRAIAPAGFIFAFNVTIRGPEYLHTEYPLEWQRIYEERNYFAADPVFRWILLHEDHKRWSEITGIDPMNVRKNARKFGLDYGAAFSRKIENKRSFLTAARTDREFTDSELEVLHAKFNTFAEIVIGTSNLTDAELQTLRYLRDGYEQQEIAAILGVSKSAVKQRVQKACSKLQARNTAQAVALCVARHYFER